MTKKSKDTTDDATEAETPPPSSQPARYIAVGEMIAKEKLRADRIFERTFRASKGLRMTFDMALRVIVLRRTGCDDVVVPLENIESFKIAKRGDDD